MHCEGYGLRRRTRRTAGEPCNCVLRAIFQACYARYRYLQTKEGHLSSVSLHASGGKARKFSWGRKDEEFCADFYLVSRRALTAAEFRIFRAHYLAGEDWRSCSAGLGMDRGNFFHAVYRIQQKLGRVFRELRPYALFPLDEYFSGTVASMAPTGASMTIGGRRTGARRAE